MTVPVAGDVVDFATARGIVNGVPVAEGLFSGYGTTGELRPGAGATRAQVATVLMRFIARMYE